MIDHVSVAVSDLSRATAFYDRALGPLGYTRMITLPAAAGYGKRYPEFWLNLREGMAPVPPGSGAHVCLRAADEGAVRAFHDAAETAGGDSDGAPGLRRAALTTYFGAFIRDPDGNRVEALTFPPAP